MYDHFAVTEQFESLECLPDATTTCIVQYSLFIMFRKVIRYLYPAKLKQILFSLMKKKKPLQ